MKSCSKYKKAVEATEEVIRNNHIGVGNLHLIENKNSTAPGMVICRGYGKDALVHLIDAIEKLLKNKNYKIKGNIKVFNYMDDPEDVEFVHLPTGYTIGFKEE